jgi:hypothetical protein
MISGSSELERYELEPCLERDGSPTDHRSRTAVARAKELNAHYAVLADCYRASKAAGRKNLAVAWSLWEQASTRRAAYLFWMSASVDGERHFAAWSENRLVVHPELEARAEVVVRLGETFEAPEWGCSVPAGFDEPIQAALTLMRAADEIHEFSLRVDDLVVAYRGDGGVLR